MGPAAEPDPSPHGSRLQWGSAPQGTRHLSARLACPLSVLFAWLSSSYPRAARSVVSHPEDCPCLGPVSGQQMGERVFPGPGSPPLGQVRHEEAQSSPAPGQDLVMNVPRAAGRHCPERSGRGAGPWEPRLHSQGPGAG